MSAACEGCGGTGRAPEPEAPLRALPAGSRCPRCDGRGGIGVADGECPECNGAGCLSPKRAAPLTTDALAVIILRDAIGRYVDARLRVEALTSAHEIAMHGGASDPRSPAERAAARRVLFRAWADLISYRSGATVPA